MRILKNNCGESEDGGCLQKSTKVISVSIKYKWTGKYIDTDHTKMRKPPIKEASFFCKP